jgi:hypothetical protein
MPPEFVTVKECASAVEAAFIASYLENNGIMVHNTADDMRAWTGRYSQIARGPKLRVHAKDAARARQLLENPPVLPETPDDPSLPDVQSVEIPEGVELDMCPVCGSENIESYRHEGLFSLLLSLLTLGMFKASGATVWVCRNCDWDSNRR